MSALPRAVDTPEETLRLAVAAVTDAAGRDENQDLAAALAIGGTGPAVAGESFLLVVADGMGGHPAGDVASQIAMTTLVETFPTRPDGDLGLALKQAYRREQRTDKNHLGHRSRLHEQCARVEREDSGRDRGKNL